MSTMDLLIVQRTRVREACGKSDKDVAEDIEIMKNWLKTQCPHLPEMPSDNLVETILVTNKFSIERAKQKLDMYYTIRSLIPDLYENKHPKAPLMQEVARTSLSCLLPKLTKDLYRVHVVKFGEHPDDFDFFNFCAYQLHIMEVKAQEDLNLGDVYIVDEANVKMGHVVKMTPANVKKLATVLEKVFSNRIKGVHIINYPPFVDILLNMAKAVLKPKLVRRMHLHSNIEELYQYISKDVLPSNYGGEEKSLEELNDLWKIKLEEYSDRFEKLEAMKVNERLRPEELKNDEILGFYGNFRKLEVD